MWHRHCSSNTASSSSSFYEVQAQAAGSRHSMVLLQAQSSEICCRAAVGGHAHTQVQPPPASMTKPSAAPDRGQQGLGFRV